MSIIINTEEQATLAHVVSCSQFVSWELYSTLNYLIESVEKRNHTKSCLTSSKQKQQEKTALLLACIKEQQQIDEQLKSLLGTKNTYYGPFLEDFETNTRDLSISNTQLHNLTEKLTLLNLKTVSLAKAAKRYSVSSVEYDNKLRSEDVKIEFWRQQLEQEYNKVNWHNIGLDIKIPYAFEKIRNGQVNQLLQRLARKNIEFEKSIVQLIQKTSHNLLVTNKIDKNISTVKQINIYVDVNNKIYDFISDLINRNEFLPETMELLQQLEKLIYYVTMSAKANLHKDKSINLSGAVKTIKFETELRSKEISQQYRPAVFYKKRLESYNLDFEVVYQIINDINLLLESMKHHSEAIPKTYSYCHKQ